MTFKKNFPAIVVLIFLFSFTASTNFQELVLEKLEAYTKRFPEKVYLQTDKPYYTIGDNIWYAAYLVDGVSHKKSEQSNIIYVELINEKDSIVATRKLFTEDISAAGEFKIEEKWPSGNYLLRGYTNYMRNSNPDYFFKKQIPIWDIKKQDTITNTTTNGETGTALENETIFNERPDLHFYPEGGYLIDNVSSKVAIKIKNKAFQNKNMEGVIKDSDNNTISSFKIFKFGLSYLTITPLPNKSYYAKIRINGKEEKYELPKALPEGFSLQAVNYNNGIALKASSNTSIGLKNAFLVAHQRGKVIFEKVITTNTNSYEVKLNTSALRSGVTNLTLFDNTGKPVCERLVFINNDTNDVAVTVNKNTENPKTREKVTLEIDLKQPNNTSLSGNLSLTINDRNGIQKNYDDDTIKTYLLLNSDLRGRIENPGYFFKKGNDAERLFLLDLVMLTHGWSRFTWEGLLYSPPKKNKYESEKGFYISGITSDWENKSKNISSPTRLTILKEGEIPFQEIQQSNENGIFNFGPYAFYDSIPALMEARVKSFKNEDRKNRNVQISILKNKYRSPEISRENLLQKSKLNKIVVSNFIEQAANKYVLDTAYANSDQRLKEIVIRAKKKTEKEIRNKSLDSISSYGSPNRRIDLNDIPGSESLSIASLLIRLPGITIINDSIIGRGGRAPQILLDEIPVEYDDVSFLNGTDIEFIDFLSGANAAIIRNSSSGVISIYTKTGGGYIANTGPEPGIISFDYPGFYSAREFYSPDYSDSFIDTSKKDVRSTLYWNPKIIVTENSKAEVTFYTSDVRSDYGIEIEGITDNGVPVYHFSTFSVE